MKNLLVVLIIFYQRIISPFTHQLLGVKTVCRNNPRCTVYAKEVITRYGVIKGSFLATRRLLNCQPFFSI